MSSYIPGLSCDCGIGKLKSNFELSSDNVPNEGNFKLRGICGCHTKDGRDFNAGGIIIGWPETDVKLEDIKIDEILCECGENLENLGITHDLDFYPNSKGDIEFFIDAGCKCKSRRGAFVKEDVEDVNLKIKLI